MAIGNDYLPYSDKLVINDYFKDWIRAMFMLECY
jgi:hypothetical protein